MGHRIGHVLSLRGIVEEKAPDIFSVHDAKLSLVTKESSTARPDIGCSHQGITLCHSGKALDCIPGIHFWEKMEGNEPNILCMSSSQMWDVVQV